MVVFNHQFPGMRKILVKMWALCNHPKPPWIPGPTSLYSDTNTSGKESKKVGIKECFSFESFKLPGFKKDIS
jgi:hypothetical protein